MKPGTTIHTVQLKNCVVVIKNVPCMKCEQCGEVILSADTIEKIERILQTSKRLWQRSRRKLPGLCCIKIREPPCRAFARRLFVRMPALNHDNCAICQKSRKGLTECGGGVNCMVMRRTMFAAASHKAYFIEEGFE